MSVTGPFSGLRAALAQQLRELLPEIKSIDEHAGEFTPDDVAKLSLKAPALYVAVLGVRPSEPVASGGVSATLKVGIFIVTRDAPDCSRDIQALDIAADLLKIADRFFAVDPDGKTRCQPGRNGAWALLPSADLQAKKIMLSAVTFDMVVTLAPEEEILPVFRVFKAGEAGPELIIPSEYTAEYAP